MGEGGRGPKGAVCRQACGADVPQRRLQAPRSALVVPRLPSPASRPGVGVRGRQLLGQRAQPASRSRRQREDARVPRGEPPHRRCAAGRQLRAGDTLHAPTGAPPRQQAASLPDPGRKRRVHGMRHPGQPLGVRHQLDVRGSRAAHQRVGRPHHQQPVAGAAEGAEDQQGALHLLRLQHGRHRAQQASLLGHTVLAGVRARSKDPLRRSTSRRGPRDVRGGGGAWRRGLPVEPQPLGRGRGAGREGGVRERGHALHGHRDRQRRLRHPHLRRQQRRRPAEGALRLHRRHSRSPGPPSELQRLQRERALVPRGVRRGRQRRAAPALRHGGAGGEQPPAAPQRQRRRRRLQRQRPAAGGRLRRRAVRGQRQGPLAARAAARGDCALGQARAAERGGRWLVTSQGMVVILAAVVLVILLLAIALAFKARRTSDKRHAKRNVKTSESLMKSAKDANRDMCIIVPDEDEKPPDIQYQNPPEVITMTNPYIDDLYCSRESKPPSPYLGEYQKEEPSHKKENVFVRLHNTLTRRKKHPDCDEGSQLQTFGDKVPISPHQSIESRIEDAHNRWLPDVQAGLEPERVHIITGMTTPC